MSSVVLLVAVPYGSQRSVCKGTRIRHSFLHTSWLQELWQRHGIEYVQTVKHQNKIFTCLGAARVEAGIACQDLLTRFSHRQAIKNCCCLSLFEVRAWAEYWRDPLDGYTLVITDVFLFNSPVQMYTCRKSAADVDPVSLAT
eukprot:1896111-Amphidinium_carterae.1